MDNIGLEKSETQHNNNCNSEVGSTAYYSDEDADMDESDPSKLEEDAECLKFHGTPYKNLTLEDLKDVEFTTIDEVDQFYSDYSHAVGFSMRKNKLDKNRAGTRVVRRQLVCSKEGQRRGYRHLEPSNEDQWPTRNEEFSKHWGKTHPDRHIESSLGKKRSSGEKTGEKKVTQTRRLTRGNCPVSFTVKLCAKRGVYYASEFVTEHNHDLARPEHRHFLRSNRKVKDSDVASVNALRKVSVRTCYAYEYLVNQAGGHEFVGFTLKDLYNKLQGEKVEIMMDGDAQSSIMWMNMKALRDPHFYCIFSVDEHGRLANMFWRDGQSLTDYNCFGDILILDSTYKSNIYAKPLAVFVGCNNHRATVLFGCALLVDETEETYRWLLTCFLTSMYGKMPTSVITDGDVAMRNVVSSLIPDARHRLCAWHIARNVCSNLKGVDRQRDFFHLIFAGISVDEWEEQWQYFVAMNQLQDNKWVAGMYAKRDRWAEAFFRDHFFGGICSTQRCEGMHRNLKGGIGRQMRLYEVLPRMEKTISRIRNRIAEDDYKSQHYEPVLGTHMRCLQVDVGKNYTHDVFLLIKDQINYEAKFVVAERAVEPKTGATVVWVTQYAKPERRWTVWYMPSPSNPTFQCSCKLFESDGIPCCHIFTVMKYEMITAFPESLVNKRWTKEATTTRPILDMGSASERAVQIARYGDLMTICAKICHTATCSTELYHETRGAFEQLNIRTQRKKRSHKSPKEVTFKDGLHPNVIRDPVVCRTKGDKNKQDSGNDEEYEHHKVGGKCTLCGNPGHNRRTCSLVKLSKQEKVASAPTHSTGIGSSGKGENSTLFSEDDTDSRSNSDDDSGDGGFDVEFLRTDEQKLMHHNEEVRPFEFVGGYNRLDSKENETSGFTPMSLFDGFPTLSSA